VPASAKRSTPEARDGGRDTGRRPVIHSVFSYFTYLETEVVHWAAREISRRDGSRVYYWLMSIAQVSTGWESVNSLVIFVPTFLTGCSKSLAAIAAVWGSGRDRYRFLGEQFLSHPGRKGKSFGMDFFLEEAFFLGRQHVVASVPQGTFS
jgi:hypothetical protein